MITTNIAEFRMMAAQKNVISCIKYLMLCIKCLVYFFYLMSDLFKRLVLPICLWCQIRKYNTWLKQLNIVWYSWMIKFETKEIYERKLYHLYVDNFIPYVHVLGFRELQKAN